MIKGKDIVIVGLQPWDISIGSNCKNIAIEFSKFNRVLYVNAPIDRKTKLFQSRDPNIKKRLDIAKSGKNLIQVSDNIWNLYPIQIIESINWIPSTTIFKSLNKINNRRFGNEILKAIQKLSFIDYILFNDSDMLRSFYLPEILAPSLSIYYSRDNLMSQPYYYKHGHVLEPQLMSKSDIVFANSEYLAKYALRFNTNSFNIGQGCDLSVFHPYQKNIELPDIDNIKGPIIGYIGAISSLRLDIPLLEKICEERPDWNFVFIGGQDQPFLNSSLHDKKNVFFLGMKDVNLLPNYLAKFDLAINPQSLNPMTEGNYPRKIDEYLAMGKPVVATSTLTMEIFKNHVYLGKTPGEFILLIEKGLIENSEKKKSERISFANTHTWENCIIRIYQIISDLFPNVLI